MSKNSDNIKRSASEQKQWNAEARAGRDIYEEYQSIFESIAAELGKTLSNAEKAKREYNNLVSISKQLSNNQEEITELSDKQLKKLRSSAEESVKEIARITKKIAAQKKGGAELTESEKALMAARGGGLKLEKELIDKIHEELELRERSNEAMGAAGNIISGLTAISGGFSKALKLDKVEKDMRAVADEAARTKDEFGKIKVLAAGVGSAISNAFDTLTDPAVILGSIVKAFGELSKSQKEFRQQTGQNADNFSNINTSLASSKDLIKASTMLSKELGVNANVIFGPETITEVAELTEFMGMGAHEAANLAKFAKLSGQELGTVTANMEAGFKSFVQTNKVGLNIKDVMNDVGSASKAVTLSLGSQPEKIQAAAMEARKLGLSLEQVDKIAGSLLDFESSIQAEMEAEMLTGKQLNLDKARQLALANDLEGVAKEIGKNEGILKAFSSGNRIQQEATAKAMGMSREEMAKMIYQQKLQSGLTSEQAAKAADISLDEAKRLTTQEQISKALEKMAAAAATILDIFAPILSNSVVLFGVITSIGFIMTAKVLTSLKGSVGEMKSLVKGSLSFLKNTKLSEALIGKFYKGGQFMKGGGQAAAGGQRKGGLMGGLVNKVSGGAATAAGKAGDVVGKTSGQAKNLKPGMGKLIKGFFGGLGQGLKLFAKAMATNTPLGPVGLVGPLALAMLTASLIPLGFALNLAAPAFKAFGTIITSIFAGVATVITAVAKGFVLIMENMTMEKIKPMFLLGPALFGIAGGLAAMAIAGLGALPIIGALGALALVAAPLAALAGIFGGGEGGGDDGDDPIVKKLDELIEIVSKGGDVIMDGNKVGRTVMLASSGIG